MPFEQLSANNTFSGWFTAESLVSMYLQESDRAPVLDLSGGQPDLIPEWIPDTIRALKRHHADDSTYLWSDDNLSNDYFWRYLTPDDIDLVRGYSNYGRVGCFKGFDPQSFAYNTGAAATAFDDQFELFKRLWDLGIDLYAYVTLTGTSIRASSVQRFIDRLQRISEALPLRTIPLEIAPYSVVTSRLGGGIPSQILEVQLQAIEIWNSEIERRFSTTDRTSAMSERLN